MSLATDFLVDYLVAGKAQQLAQGQRAWFPARLEPPPDQFHIMAKGSPQGPFHAIVESIAVRRYDKEKDLFIEERLDETKRRLIDQDNFWATHGMVWVGFNNYYLEQEVAYSDWEETGEHTAEGYPKWALVLKERGHWEEHVDQNGKKYKTPPAYFWRYTLAVVITKAETTKTAEGGVPIDMVVKITVEVESPRRAFFYEGGWIGTLDNMIRAKARAHAKTKTFDEVAAEQDDAAGSLVKEIMGLNGNTHDEAGSLRGEVGVKISQASLALVDYSGGQKMLDAMERVAISIKNLEAARNDAQATAAKVAAYASHPVGSVVAIAEAISAAKPQVIGQGVFPTMNIDTKKD